MSERINNLFDLGGKVIVVTGAAGLLGEKHAEAISASGGVPILLDLDMNRLQRLQDDLNNKYDAGATGFRVDVTNEVEIQQNASVIVEQFGKIDGLVNNAANNPAVVNDGGLGFTRLESFSLEQWKQDLDVGLTGAFLCAKHYGSKIAENMHGGCIVNISSDLGLIAPDQRLYSIINAEESEQPVKPVTYSVIKTALIGLTRYLATYWPNHNVRCNALCPGGVENGQSDVFIEKVSRNIPLNRLAKPNEYQSSLVWMMSDASSYLNGAVVAVDGGRTAW